MRIIRSLLSFPYTTQMDITFHIRPTSTLPAERLSQIAEKAEALKITPEQFVVDAILAKLEAEEKEVP